MTRFAFLLFLGSIIASTGTYAESVLKTERLADNVYALARAVTVEDENERDQL